MKHPSAQQFYIAILSLVIIFSFPLSVQSQVLVNELMPSNQQTISDQEGDYPDWIELYNPSESPINLGGYGISDDPDDQYQFVFSDIEIEPDSYFLLFASDKSLSGTEVYWETVVREGDETKYVVPESPVSSTWIQPEFDDSDWDSGPFGIGYGDGDDNTVVDEGTISVFTRTAFNIEDVDKIASMVFHVDYDDGYIAYLNGEEIHRVNMNGDAPQPYDVFTTTYVEKARLFRGLDLIPINLNEHTDLLNNGENVLAIQVHNTNSSSSDMTLIPFLSIGYSDLPEEPRGVAEATNLPASGVNYPHLNFKLSSSGETIVLTDSSGNILDEVTFPSLNPDESYGRTSSNINIWSIFPNPTPLEPNPEEGFTERLAIPELTNDGGFSTSEAIIDFVDTTVNNVYYTTDGNIPDENDALFEPPMTFNQTTILRLRAMENGKLSSNVQTHTYFVNESHDLPVISLVTEPDLLWSDEQGIYVRGTNGIPGNCEDGPVNWNQDWEIPAHMEFYETNHSLGFSSGIGTKIFGGCSRVSPQKSLSVFFRGEYGNPELEYQLFEEKDIDTFQAIVLRNSGNDFGYTHIRDAMMKTLIQDDTEIDYQAYQPAVVYLNGEYWGIHNIREKINEHFIASNHNVDPDNIDLIENNGFIKHGLSEAYSELMSRLENADMQTEEGYESVLEYVDLDSYIDYLAAQIFFANQDWPGNNLRYWRERKDGAKFKWIIYDTDFGFNMYGNRPPTINMFPFVTKPDGTGWPNPSWSTFMIRKMLENESFEDAFVNRFGDLLSTIFTPEHIEATIDSLVGNIESEMSAHQTRFNRSMGNWEGNLDQIRDFGENRSGYIESHIQNFFGVSARKPLTVDISNEGGTVRVNRVQPKSYPWTGEYFGDVPVQVTAAPKPGYEFVGWSGASTSVDATITISPNDEPELTANFERSSGSSTDIVINEIMYNADENADPGDWIELFNAAIAPIDISGWILKDEDDEHEFILPENTEIAGEGYLVIAQSSEEFNAIYFGDNAVPNVIGDMGYGLGGGGDQVRLYDAEGSLIDSLEYDDSEPWPTAPDGDGYTLELKEFSLDNSVGENWAASLEIGGSPGKENSVVNVSKEDEKEIPRNISLNQNYPNPFNPTTVISYQLSENSVVRLEVFDMLGRKVASLIDGERKPAGVHQIEFEARNLASGIYIYRMDTGDQFFTKKMLLLK